MLSPASIVHPTRHGGWTAFRLETDECAVTLVPALGARVVSLVNRRTGREFLVQPRASQLRPPRPGDSFVDSDPAGFDDMCPTILAGPLVLPNGEQIELPDHGEVWSRVWRVEAGAESLMCTIDGATLPFRLTKRCSLPNARTLQLDYTLSNLGSFSYDVLWAAHPLIDCRDAVEVDLPAVEIVSVHDGSLRYGNRGTRNTWQRMVLASASPGQPARAHKFYTAAADTVRTCRIRFPASEEGLTFRFFSDHPACFGLWHEERSDGARIIAPEPCIAGFDHPHAARLAGQGVHLAPGAERRWRLEIELTSRDAN